MISPLLIVCATVVAAAVLAACSYRLKQRRTPREVQRYVPLPPRPEPKTREEIIAMLERQFNNSPSSGPPERNL
jgi:peptidoglycan/LPS O-acetylase OafA/YrhL